MLHTKVSLNSSFPSSSFEQEIAPCSSICNASYATKSKRKQEFWHLVPSLFLLLTYHSLRVRAINWTNTFWKLECFMVCPCRPPPYSSTTRLCLSSLPRMSCSINFPVNTFVFIEWPHFFISRNKCWLYYLLTKYSILGNLDDTYVPTCSFLLTI